MRKLVPLFALVVVLGSCSSSEPMAFDLMQPMAPPPVAITISGEAAEEGVVCPSGEFVGFQMSDMEGNPIEMDDWGAMFESAIETSSIAEARSLNDYQCDDGSGTITIDQHVRFDFAEIDIETLGQSEITNGTWTVSGSGDYESLTGSGDLVSDNAEEIIHMIGEVEA